MPYLTIDLFAYLLVLALLMLFAVISFQTAFSPLPQPVLQPFVTVAISVLGVTNFMYPVAIIRKRLQKGSYSFLRKKIHYFAIFFSIILWVTVLST